MTKQFTTPCYIRIEDKDKRKEVCEKLYRSGYLLGQAYIDALDNVIITYPESGTFCTGSDGQFDEIDLKGCVDCGTNIPTFLALAAMNDTDDKDQWFIRIDTKELYLCKAKKFKCAKNIPGGFYRKATVPEIIEHFKTKEK